MFESGKTHGERSRTGTVLLRGPQQHCPPFGNTTGPVKPPENAFRTCGNNNGQKTAEAVIPRGPAPRRWDRTQLLRPQKCRALRTRSPPIASRQTGSVLHPFCHVSLALRRALQGDTILLLPGRYPRLRVAGVHCAYDRPLTIRGLSRDTVLVGLRGEPRLPGEASAAVELVDCSNVCLSDMTVGNAACGVRVAPDCAYVRVARVGARDTQHVLELPDRHNHCIALEDVREAGARGCGRRCWRWVAALMVTGRAPEARELGGRPLRALLRGVAALYAVVWTVLTLAYAQHFFAMEGDASRVNEWVVSALVGWGVNCFVEQPLVVSVGYAALVLWDKF